MRPPSIGQSGQLEQPALDQPQIQSDPNTLLQRLRQPQEPQTAGFELARDVKQTISENKLHPVNSLDSSVYYSRTGNLVGLTSERQTEALADTLRSVGPGKVLLIETVGPLGGSYVEELRRSLPQALKMVPESERPEIRFFVSDGRPVLPNPNNPNTEYNQFSDYLTGLNQEKRGSGMVDRDTSLPNIDRGIPNWGNPKVVDYFIKERIDPTIALAKELGIKSIVVDDHIGVPPDKGDSKTTTNFKKANGLTAGRDTDDEFQNIITGAYGQVFKKIKDAGLDAGLSVPDQVDGSKKNFGIDVNKLAPLTDSIEIQAYRPSADLVEKMTDNLFSNISKNFEQYKNVEEIKVALVTRASGVDLSEAELIKQQKVIDAFQEDINTLYRARNIEPPNVGTSLWAHQNFYK